MENKEEIYKIVQSLLIPVDKDNAEPLHAEEAIINITVSEFYSRIGNLFRTETPRNVNELINNFDLKEELSLYEKLYDDVIMGELDDYLDKYRVVIFGLKNYSEKFLKEKLKELF